MSLSMAVIPNLIGQVPPHAYGIHARSDGRWESVLDGEVIAIRNTATDAGYALVGFREGDSDIESLLIEDCIGLPALDYDQMPIPNPGVFLLMLVVSAAAIGALGWIIYAVVNHSLR